MENRFSKSSQLFERDETEGKIIQLYPNSNSIDSNIEEEKITISIPKGYKAKVILEKEDESSKIPKIVEPNLDDSNLNRLFSNNAIEEIAATSMVASPLTTSTSIYDIIKLHRETTSLIRRFEGYNINKEELDMRKLLMYDVLKEQIKFLIMAICFIIMSLIGMIVFNRTGFYIIHPLLYIITLLMGIGWGATALASIKNNKV